MEFSGVIPRGGGGGGLRVKRAGLIVMSLSSLQNRRYTFFAPVLQAILLVV